MSLIEKIKEKEKEQRKEYDSVFWKPTEGEIIEGSVNTEVGQIETAYGVREFIEVKTDEGKRYTIFLNKVLLDNIAKEDVKRGDRIAIKYLGEMSCAKTPSKRFKNYILVKGVGPQSAA